MATPASKIVTGDLDGDGLDDLIGIWPLQGGVWIKYSSSGIWERLASTADWIAAGKMRDIDNTSIIASIQTPKRIDTEGPGNMRQYEDISNEGPGGCYFVYEEEKNLTPKETISRMNTIPSPGEVGFQYVEEKNLVPWEQSKKKDKKITKRSRDFS